jgi:hypothetical protein
MPATFGLGEEGVEDTKRPPELLLRHDHSGDPWFCVDVKPPVEFWLDLRQSVTRRSDQGVWADESIRDGYRWLAHQVLRGSGAVIMDYDGARVAHL